MKKLIQFIAIITILLSAKNASAYDFECDGFYFNVISTYDLTCCITYSADYRNRTDIKIPTTVTFKNKELNVTSVADMAFYGCYNLKSITMPNSITSIGERAFKDCENLTSVINSESITSIGNDAFYNCKNLTSINLPNSIKEIGMSAFQNCISLTSLTLPDSITKIYPSLCEGCTSLTSIKIPKAVTSIRYNAFYNCTSLQSVDISETVTEIGSSAFESCPITSITIPNSVKSIGTRAFKNCTNLSSVKLSTSLEAIKGGTFANCSNLSFISIPNSVQYITDYIFTHEPSVSPFDGCTNLELTLEPIPRTMLNPIKINCNINVKTLNIYRNISEESERFVSGLTEIRVGDYVTIPFITYNYVYSNILQENSATLERLTLGKNVKKFPYDLRAYSKLKYITLTTDTPPTDYYRFSNKQYMDIVVTVPKGSLELYQQAEGWKNFWELREDDTSGIDDITADSGEKTEIGRYDLFGRKVSDSQKGFVIIKYSDGSTKKTLIK